MKAVYAKIEGITASFKIPYLVSGTQLCSPLPFYSTILGLIGCCAGREIKPEEINIGFIYKYSASHIDLVETTSRLMVNNGKLSTNKEKGLNQREFHYKPNLELYLVGNNVYEWLSNPVGVPCLGRSQDIVWIKELKYTELEKQPNATIENTWIPFNADIHGRIMRFSEFYTNANKGFVRIPSKPHLFAAIEDPCKLNNKNTYIEIGTNKNIYIHEWIEK